MRIFRRLIPVVLFLSTTAIRAETVTVFAAASLSDALEEIARDYARANPDGSGGIRFNFAASSTLARQIAGGAPADLFFSADEAQMDAVAARGLLAPGTRRALLANTLVIIVPARARGDLRISAPADLLSPKIRRVALADPAIVPAGVYARAWLARAGFWQTLSSADGGKIVPCENVRAALAAVATGNADAAIVYRTDALAAATLAQVRIACEIPAAETPGISYPFAILKNARARAAAERFAAHLASPGASVIFSKHGFLVPTPDMQTQSSNAGHATAGSPALRVRDFAQITLFTIAVAALGTLLVLPPGIALAYLLARFSWRGKTLVETLVMLPLVVPPVATGLILLKIFGQYGAPGAFFADTLGVEIVFTWRAVVIAAAVMSLPLFVRTARVAFENIAPQHEQAARALGCGHWRVFFRITLPLAARGLTAGALLAFARALGEFGATIMIAGYIPGRTATLSLAIYHNVQLGRDGAAFALLAISALLAFGAVWASEIFLKGSPRGTEP